MQRGDWEKAARLYREYLRDHPHDILSLRHLAEIECYKFGQYPPCASHADTLFALMPIDSEGIAVAAYAHTMLARQAGARKDSARARAEMDRVVDIYYQAGYVSYMQENHRQAEALLQRVHRLRPRDVRTLLRLGILYWTLDKADSALAWFRRAEAVDSNNEDALVNQIVVYHERGRIDDALAIYRKLTALRKRLYPDSVFVEPIDTTRRKPVLDYRGSKFDRYGPIGSF